MVRHKKRLLFVIFIVFLAFILLIKGSSILNSLDHWFNASFCEKPVTYRIGEIDDRFGISENNLKDYVSLAADIWANAYEKPLFLYDEESPLEINMVYDERQKVISKITEIENDLEKKKDIILMSSEKFDEELDSYNKKVSQLNEDIEFWNRKGGAPADKYKELTERQKILESEGIELKTAAEQLNKNIDTVNDGIDNLNEDVGYFNNLLNFHPEVGIYTSGERKIDIFFYENEEYLVNVLAHEMGHALGLGHIDEEGAIMNPILSENTSLKTSDVSLIKNFCSEKNRLDLIKNDLNNFVYTLLSKISLMLE